MNLLKYTTLFFAHIYYNDQLLRQNPNKNKHPIYP